MKPGLILIGGGGHCASCIDVIEQEGRFEIAGIVDEALGSAVLGYPIIGRDEDLARLREKFEFALVTAGQIKSPALRLRLYKLVKAHGYNVPTVISPRAYVSRHAKVGEGTIIMHDALVNSRARIGINCIVNSKALIEHDAIVEDGCHISTAAVVNGGAVIQVGTFVGSNAVTREGIQTEENAFIKAGSVFSGGGNG